MTSRGGRPRGVSLRPSLTYNPAVSPLVVLALFAAAFGLIVGSYLNVVIHRLPLGLSTVRPRSRCPQCGTPIAAFDNIPVLSYLWLRGRCRHCRAEISARYPLVEATTAVLFVAGLVRFGPTLAAVAAMVLVALLLALALIDLDHMILPDVLTWPGIAAGIALQLGIGGVGGMGGMGGIGWKGALFGAALGAGILLAIRGAYLLLRGEEGMGLGDVKMLAMVGAFLGWKGVVVTLFSASFAGALVGVIAMRRAGSGVAAGMKIKLPFGFFLSLGGLFALFAGDRLVDAYLALAFP